MITVITLWLLVVLPGRTVELERSWYYTEEQGCRDQARLLNSDPNIGARLYDCLPITQGSLMPQ